MSDTLCQALLVSCCLLFQPALRERPADDAGRVVGTWTLAGGQVRGKQSPGKEVLGSTVVFTRDTIRSLDSNTKETYVARYVIDTTRTPWGITMTSIKPRAGDKAEGIIAVEGDTLRLCYALPGGDRPTTFQAGAKQMQFSFKRNSDRKK